MPKKWLKKEALAHIKSIWGDKLALDRWAEKEFKIKLNRSYKFKNMLEAFWKHSNAPKELEVKKEVVKKVNPVSELEMKYKLLRENPKLRIT